ncbi:MAG TPA: helix-turn-helix transcriptional regulator [Rectinemataceae bacterium]
MPKDYAPSPQPVILGFLMLGPAHPYELFKEFERDLGQVWRVGRASLYARLKRAEEEGLVEVEVAEAERAPDRRVHRITEAGRVAFLAWLGGTSESVRDIRLEFLARLYFFRRLGPGEREGMEGQGGLEQAVSLQKAALASRIAALERGISEAAAANDEFRRLVLEFRRSEARAAIEWLDACIP